MAWYMVILFSADYFLQLLHHFMLYQQCLNPHFNWIWIQFLRIPANTCWYLSYFIISSHSVNWYLIVVSICIFLMTGDIQHLFMGKHLLHLFNRGIFLCIFLCWFSGKNSFYILLTRPLSHIWFESISSCFMSCLHFLVWLIQGEFLSYPFQHFANTYAYKNFKIV